MNLQSMIRFSFSRDTQVHVYTFWHMVFVACKGLLRQIRNGKVWCDIRLCLQVLGCFKTRRLMEVLKKHVDVTLKNMIQCAQWGWVDCWI